MSSTLSSEGDSYSNSKYSAFDDTAAVSTLGDSTSFRLQSNTAAPSMSLADVKFGNEHVTQSKPKREYTWDEFFYALSSPSSIGAIGWIVSSFVAVIYGSSIIVYLNFCIPLFLGPYVIKEQMPAQLLPAVRRKYNKIRAEATELQIKNIQLKGNVSRMQRQEYRLTVVEARFEHMCRRSDKDVAKMKQLARKNASLKHKIKVNLAGKKLENLLSRMLLVDIDANHRISEKKIYEAVMLMKEFAGKTTFGTIDNEIIHNAIVTSLGKNLEVKVVPNIDIDSETNNWARDYDGREMYNKTEGGRMSAHESRTEEPTSKMDIIARPSHQSHEGESIPEEEAVAVSMKYENALSMHLEPSGHVRHGMGSSVHSGTSGKPIDVEKLLFQAE